MRRFFFKLEVTWKFAWVTFFRLLLLNIYIIYIYLYKVISSIVYYNMILWVLLYVLLNDSDWMWGVIFWAIPLPIGMGSQPGEWFCHQKPNETSLKKFKKQFKFRGLKKLNMLNAEHAETRFLYRIFDEWKCNFRHEWLLEFFKTRFLGEWQLTGNIICMQN